MAARGKKRAGVVRRAIEATAEALKVHERLLRRAQRRYKADRARARIANGQKVRARERADRLRAHGHDVLAGRADVSAAKARQRQAAADDRAQRWLGAIKRHQRKVHKLDDRLESLRRELDRLEGPVIRGNRATGGTAEERWKAVVLASIHNCQARRRRNFYSQEGSWDVDHPIRPGESHGERSDCSQTLTAWAKAAGLPDPNGTGFTGGFTGTLLGGHNGWREVSRRRMLRHGWGYVVYGGGDGHHVEAYIGPGDRTGGHGSPPVDIGVIDLFGPGEVQRYFIYDPD